jgi:hypothetical protein
VVKTFGESDLSRFRLPFEESAFGQRNLTG